jgi:TolA-binding protein
MPSVIRIMRGACTALALVVLCAAGVAAPEASLSRKDFENLDPFEARSLARGDKAFGEAAWRLAKAEYDAFMLEFPKSTATAYALLRAARCLQMDNKRYEAIKAYHEVLDYFPDAIPYAAAALEYLGECHMQNGETSDAAKAWQELADDTDYRRQAVAADAIVGLAGMLLKNGDPAAAAQYYMQAALDFRQSNSKASQEAMAQALYVLVRVKPDAAKLSEFHAKAKGFDRNPRQDTSDAEFWALARAKIRELGQFAKEDDEGRRQYYGYWADAMEGKRPADDDFQIDAASFRKAADGDVAAWTARLDREFAARQKEGDTARVVRWILAFAGHPEKMSEYYAKLNFSRMNNAQMVRLLMMLFQNSKTVEMGRAVYQKLDFGKMSDRDKIQLARDFRQIDEAIVVDVCGRVSDPELGRMELLRYYHFQRNSAKGVALADECAGAPACAREAYYMKGELLQWAHKFPEAVQAFKMADNPPATLFKIAECLARMGQIEQAVAQLSEVENFFKREAGRAALQIAYVYRDAGKRDRYVAALRGVMKKHPKSGQSSAAHQELERLGIRIGGGVDAE